MSSVLAYPTGGEYREALFNTRTCFKDPALAGGSVTLDSLGLPKPVSGASASVFTVQNTDGRRWAVKCFTRFVNDQAIRYQRISEALRTVNKPWRVEFEYLPEGVLCRGVWYPALKMEWVEATGLIPFIEAHLWDSHALANLAANFAQMVEDLSVLGIAHGDLQHGNLLVTPSQELKLIDYDGMFVPSLGQVGACEKGHVNYQSPARTMSSWGPYLDNFSAWIIYASLVAVTIDPALWSILHNQGDEALLFHKNDFLDHRNSHALLALTQSPQPGLQAFSNAMSVLWTPDLRAVPPLRPTDLPMPIRQSAMPAPPKAAARANAAAGSIPDWVTQNQISAQAASASAQSGPWWVAGHLPALPLVAFNPPRAALRVLAALWLAVNMAVGVSAGTGSLSGTVAGVTSSLSIFVFVAATVALFWRTPEWRVRCEKVIILKKQQASLSKTARVVARLKRDRDDVDKREEKAADKISKKADKAKTSEQKKLAGLNTGLAAQVQKLDKQRQKIQSSESKEIGNALHVLQQQHMTACLSAARISSAGIPGIGRGVASSLAAYGITTAADFVGLHYQTGPRGGQQIFIIRRNGVPVHPSGVGEKKAHDLDNWRMSVERAAMATQPSSLPSAQAQAIRAKYAQQRQKLAGEEKAARIRTVNDQNQIRQNWKPAHDAISAELIATRQAFAQERAQIDLQLATARKQVDTMVWQRGLVEREVVAYGNVKYRRYITGVIKN